MAGRGETEGLKNGEHFPIFVMSYDSDQGGASAVVTEATPDNHLEPQTDFAGKPSHDLGLALQKYSQNAGLLTCESGMTSS